MVSMSQRTGQEASPKVPSTWFSCIRYAYGIVWKLTCTAGVVNMGLHTPLWLRYTLPPSSF